MNRICLFRCDTLDTSNLEKRPWEIGIVQVCDCAMGASWLDVFDILGIQPVLAVAAPPLRVLAIRVVVPLLVPPQPQLPQGTWHVASPAP